MKRRRGRVCLAGGLVALVLIGTAGAADAADTDGPGAPTPDVATAGLFVDAVVPIDSPYRRQIYCRFWSKESTGLSVPRASESLRVVLPPEVGELDLALGSLTIEGVARDTERSLAPTVVDLSTATELVIDLPAVYEQLAATGVDRPERIFLGLEGNDTGAARLYLDIEVTLTEAAGSAEEVRQLKLPPVGGYEDVLYFDLGPQRVGPGTRLVVHAVPGFWNINPLSWPQVDAWNEGLGFSWPFDHPVVSADGSAVTVVMPDNVGDLGPLHIQVVDSNGVLRYEVDADLLPLVAMDDVSAYVTSVYNDLFGRDPDPAGLADWTRALNNGTPYTAVADAITHSDEFRTHLITDAYATYLGRLPDAAGLADWLAAMRRGLQIQGMEAGFLASDEFYAAAGGTLDGWVGALYRDVLGRSSSPAETAWWAAVARGRGRYQVAQGFLYSTEKLGTDVSGYYDWLLRRPLDPAGHDGWVRAIQAGYRVETIIAGIIASPEYRQNAAGPA